VWRGPRIRLAVALAVVCFNAWVVVHFHDQFWWAPDEGNYAHVAERVLNGEVLHADVQDIHPGYVNFVNAAALGLFGRELVSMRYPLVILGVVQCAIIFAILAPVGLVAAAAGATIITALGFVQFLNPTAHWYALFLVILLAGVLQARWRHARWRLDAVGAIVVATLMFRQLSGVFVAMGAITFLLLEPSGDLPDRPTALTARPWAARGLIAVMLLGLAGYLVRATEQVGWLLFGIWPLLLLLWAARSTRMSNRDVVSMVLVLARGGVAAALPLVLYHAAHRSLGAWYQDTVIAATQFPRMPFFERMNYGDHLVNAVRSAAGSGVPGALNGVFWVLLTVMAVVVGCLLLMQIVRSDRGDSSEAPPALPILAVFYAVVSVHYQIPIYLTYTAGLSLVALIWLARGARSVIAGGVALAAIALYYHAGQPLSRGLGGATAGQRPDLVAARSLPRVGLRIEPADIELYGALITLIQHEVPTGSTIFAVPSHAELYFLADRPNPFPFFNTALGVRTEGDLATVLSTLERDPPTLVFYDRQDKYNTRESRAIIAQVKATFETLPPIGQFEIFRRPGHSVAARPAAQSSRE